MMVDSSNLDRFKTERLRLMPALPLAQRLKLLCPVQVLFWNVVVPPRMLGAHRWRTTRWPKKKPETCRFTGMLATFRAVKPHGKELRHLQVIATQSQSCIPNNRGIYVMELFLGTRSWQFRASTGQQHATRPLLRSQTFERRALSSSLPLHCIPTPSYMSPWFSSRPVTNSAALSGEGVGCEILSTNL